MEKFDWKGTELKVVLVIRSLNIGGAERQFIELVKNIDKNKFDIYVATMYGGVLEDEIKSRDGVKYFNLEKKGRYDFSFYFKYKNLLKKIQPDVIYSFLGEMNLFSYWCKPKKTKLIWGFRASNMDLKKYSKMSEFLFYLQKIYSKKVDKIITNSYASVNFHKNQGFFMDRAVVIHNGIDTNRFKRDESIRNRMRKKFNIKNDEVVIGIVARIDYMKGYIYLAKALKEILKNKKIKFIAVGSGDEKILNECKNILKDYKNQVYFVGSSKESEKFYNMFDIYISSSIFGEGFSNSVAEAMSTEVPCVVTDVGDSKLIVGEYGEVVNSKSEKELIKGIQKLLNKDYKSLGKLARKRIIKNFSIEKMVKKTEEELCAV